MLNMRLVPERLREEARYLRYLMGQLDHMRWRVQGSWAHLEAWGLTTYTAVEIDVRCQDLIKLLRERAELFFRYAHILEATAAWLEEADRQAANDFQSLRDS